MKDEEKYRHLKSVVKGNLKGIQNFLNSVNDEGNVVTKARIEKEILQELLEVMNELDEH